MTGDVERCELTELPVDGCAHCRGHEPVRRRQPGPDPWCATYTSRCPACGLAIEVGDPIRNELGDWVHEECWS